MVPDSDPRIEKGSQERFGLGVVFLFLRFKDFSSLQVRENWLTARRSVVHKTKDSSARGFLSEEPLGIKESVAAQGSPGDPGSSSMSGAHQGASNLCRCNGGRPKPFYSRETTP